MVSNAFPRLVGTGYGNRRRPCDKITRRAKFRFFRRANHLRTIVILFLKEGALAIVTERWDGSCGGRGGIVRAIGSQGGINSVSDCRTC